MSTFAIIYLLSFFMLIDTKIPAHGAGGVITYPYSFVLAGGYPGKDEYGMTRIEAKESIMNSFYYPAYWIIYGPVPLKVE